MFVIFVYVNELASRTSLLKMHKCCVSYCTNKQVLFFCSSIKKSDLMIRIAYFYRESIWKTLLVHIWMRNTGSVVDRPIGKAYVKNYVEYAPVVKGKYSFHLEHVTDNNLSRVFTQFWPSKNEYVSCITWFLNLVELFYMVSLWCNLCSLGFFRVDSIHLYTLLNYKLWLTYEVVIMSFCKHAAYMPYIILISCC